MLYFHHANLVYLATPKTGTTAIEDAFQDHASMVLQGFPQVKHTTWRKYNRFLAPYIATFHNVPAETVAVIREPVDWLASWYRYRQRDALKGSAKSTREVSFDQFVEGYLADEQPAYAHVGSQARFVSDGKGRPQVTHLFRYEDLPSCANFIAQRLDTKVELRQLNASGKAQSELSTDNLAAYMQKYAADFQLYDSLG